MGYPVFGRDSINPVWKVAMNALIVCNGKSPGKRLLNKWTKECNLVIAADGGAKTLIKSGIIPDFIVGDMDSFEPEIPHNLIIIHDTDQETNDLEKALTLAKKRGAKRALITGATGLRTDHTLKNLSVLQKFSSKFRDLIIEDRYISFRVIPKNFTLEHIKSGTIISLFPMSGKVKGIKTKGLLYPLNDEELENGKRDGSSNEAISDTISIEYTSGSLLLMISKK